MTLGHMHDANLDVLPRCSSRSRILSPTGIRAPVQTLSECYQAAGIAVDEPAAVEAVPVAGPGLEATELTAPTVVPTAADDATGAPALDLGQEPAVETDVAEGMGLRVGATPVKVGTSRNQQQNLVISPQRHA